VVKPAADEPVERLPRGRGLKLSGSMLTRIGMTLLLLVMLLFMQKPCSDAVSKFVTGFGSDGSAGSAVSKPGTIDLPATAPDNSFDKYEHTGSAMMTLDETKAMIDRARAKNAAEKGSAAGSAATGSGGSGSAAAGSAASSGSASSGSASSGSAGSGSAVTP
jgi:hypothetical protein